MRTALLLLAMLAAPAFAGQPIWKWVDEKGVTHYSDRPVPGATKMEISGGNRWDSAASSPPASSQSASQPAAGPPYRTLEILTPKQGENVINTGGEVLVEILTNPVLQGDHTLRLYLNGRLVEGFAPRTTTYQLRDVPRGVHTVIVTVADQRGTQLQQSTIRSFNVRQESIAKPPVGPTLRPPPKPRN